MTKQLDLIYKSGAFVPLTPLQGIFEGDRVSINVNLLNIIRATPTEEEAEDPDALNRAMAKMMNRTPEEREAARARLLQHSRAPRAIPEGQNLNDVVYGKWPGDETEEEILAALEKLS
jgi:hypothetical protein